MCKHKHFSLNDMNSLTKFSYGICNTVKQESDSYDMSLVYS